MCANTHSSVIQKLAFNGRNQEGNPSLFKMVSLCCHTRRVVFLSGICKNCRTIYKKYVECSFIRNYLLVVLIWKIDLWPIDKLILSYEVQCVSWSFLLKKQQKTRKSLVHHCFKPAFLKSLYCDKLRWTEVDNPWVYHVKKLF